MTQHVAPNFAKLSPREKRAAKRYDFNCSCGEQWNAPSHLWWAGRMYCAACGEIVESE